jgi:hypothetical protein
LQIGPSTYCKVARGWSYCGCSHPTALRGERCGRMSAGSKARCRRDRCVHLLMWLAPGDGVGFHDFDGFDHKHHKEHKEHKEQRVIIPTPVLLARWIGIAGFVGVGRRPSQTRVCARTLEARFPTGR